METQTAEARGKASFAVAVWMILLGGYSALNGFLATAEWPAYSGSTQLYYAVALLAGACLAALGLIERAPRANWSFLPVAELAIAAILSVNQITGLWWNTILCYTPG